MRFSHEAFSFEDVDAGRGHIERGVGAADDALMSDGSRIAFDGFVDADDEVLVFAQRVAVDDGRALSGPERKRRGPSNDDLSTDEELNRSVRPADGFRGHVASGILE